jgi:hypothetical protein
MTRFLVLTALLVTQTAFAQAQIAILGAWKGFSDPDIFNSGFNHELSALPLEGSLPEGTTKAWSGDYWASKKGSINIRWNSPWKEGFDYRSPTREEVLAMTPEQIATLAPSEKYDLLTGRYDYPLKKSVARSASRMAPDWAGICHGWAPASLFHNEPTPKTVTNPDGVVIPFGSADIKALLSYFYAFYHKTGTDQMGLRCFFGSWMGGARGCTDDLNAGAFHIVIANKLGLEKQGFLMDVDRFKEVWNQPVVGFKSTVLEDNLRPRGGAAERAVREVRIKTELFYVDESNPTWEPVHGTKDQKIGRRDFQYRLELDVHGNIVGGDWESRERPDFLWNKPTATPPEFSGTFSALPALLND